MAKDRFGTTLSKKGEGVAGIPQRDPRETLLVIEAERALGRQNRADRLAGIVRGGYVPRPDGSMRCKNRSYFSKWENELDKVLHEVEQREVHCVDGK